MITEVSIRCQKNPEVGIRRIPTQYTTAGCGSVGRSPPEADDFSQLKGYLDVTSGILGEGAMAPLPLPLKSASG